ncbi:MAG: hypothetical protein JWO44_239 [Bacteroidetes bacterium]|nr:hypothetical protein [Bacteroidota bacterium]
MDKQEIIRICDYYNEHGSYANVFRTSKDLGTIAEVIALVQEKISLPASLIAAWDHELQVLLQMSYLEQVTRLITNVPVRLTAITYNPRKKATTFSFAFSFLNLARTEIKVKGITISSFGADLSVSPYSPSGKRKTTVLKKMHGTEKLTPLKKAS